MNENTSRAVTFANLLWSTFWAQTKKGFLIRLIVVSLVGVSFYAVFKAPEKFSFKTQYQNIYTLVNDKVSISAPIQVNLPVGTAKEGIENNISFIPSIKGTWINTETDNVVAFKPSDKLEVGKYYTASLSTVGGIIKKDFLADENPAIVDIFPKMDSEADESSSITIVFNRPMVPLTTLSELENNSVPITITPETKGKFKWISTRNLQFIPETTLIPSAHYEVQINDGFVSMDGLYIAGTSHNFTTRPIRLINTTEGIIRYNQPMQFNFNQPVDIEKTSKNIAVVSTTTGENILFNAVYGSRTVFDQRTKKNVKLEDRSVINILPQRDSIGRKNLWNFEKNYSITLKKAYPVAGDIIFSETKTSNITTTGVIQSVTAESSRTELASPKLFDPRGTTTITFYEDINLSKSNISAKGLKKIIYGEKCEAELSTIGRYDNTPCEKIDDRSTIILSFNEEEFTFGETIPILLKQIVNDEGLILDTKEIIVPLTVYPKLQIKNIVPVNFERRMWSLEEELKKGASLTDLAICSNSPLEQKTGANFYKSIKTDKYIVANRWENAFLNSNTSWNYDGRCNEGDYVNIVRYGLLPETQYSLELSLSDVFNQTIQKKRSFVTQKAPDFYMRFHALDKIYNVTTPDKTTLTYAVENFDYVNVNICKTDPLTMVRYLKDRPSNLTSGENLICSYSVSDTIQIPPKLWVNNYFQINLASYFKNLAGNYVLTFSNPKYNYHEGGQIYERSYLSVTNLSVSEKKVFWTKYDEEPTITKETVDATDSKGELYWVNRIKTLAPEAGATVQIVSESGYANTIPEIALSGVTDINGVAKFPLIKDVVGAVITSGNDNAIISAWADTINYSSYSSSDSKIYVYTDRPIYRPGQEVFIKGIYRMSYDGEYKIVKDIPIEIKVMDSKETVIYNQKTTLNKFGTFNTSIKLPTDAALGGYYIVVNNQYSYFTVEEYVGSAFEAKLDMPKDEYIAGENAQINISGKYYFGVPVTSGTVDYSFTAQNYYFDRYTDEYFNFGSDWYNCYDCGYGDTFIKSGQTTLDENGHAQVTQILDFKQLFKDKSGDSSKIIVFHSTIKDGQGKSVSSEKSFIVHRGNFYMGIKSDPSFTGIDQPFNLKIKTVDTAGKAFRENNIDVVISKVEWKSFKRQEVDGNYFNRTERTLVPVITKKVDTDRNGDYLESLKLNSPGEYDISATAVDNDGNIIKAGGYLYVYGQGNVSVRSTNNATLDITAEKTDLAVGETGKIIFQSPYKTSKALIALERGRIFDYQIVDVTSSIYKYEFPIKKEFVPNVFASVLLLSPDPEIKYGQVQFKIDQKENELTINIEADKKAYLPGEKVSLKVTTTDISGKRVPAEVSVAVADLSVLALKGNPKKNPLIFFYNNFPLTVTTATNIKNILAEAEIPTGTKGGDGGNAADLAKKQRGEFKDTAFWKAEVETNANGEATVVFTLPDNLTRWQIETLGLTVDSKFGVKYNEITARKDIMLVPLRPRFVVPGDEFEIGAQVFNQTDRAQNLAISYESPTLSITDNSQNKNISIRAGESTTVYFSVKSPLSQIEGVHSITLSAKNNEYEDTVKNEININSNITYEAVATANSTSDKIAKEYIYVPDNVLKDKGGLTIKTSATLAIYMSDALKSLIQFPYGCSEQIASKLSSIAIVKKGLAVKNVENGFVIPPVQFDGVTYTVDDAVAIGLKKIYETQTISGGFSYYKGLPPDLYLTIDILNALKELKEANYPINANVINSAASYIGNELLSKGIRQYGIDSFVAGAYAISQVGSESITLSSLKNAILSSANSAFINEKSSSMTLGYLALLTSDNQWPEAFTRSVNISLENRVDIDSRGAYVKSNTNNITWQYYETQIKNTALFLKVIAKNKNNFSQTDKILRWLLASRSIDGSWGSTQNTLSVIDAFTEYLSWKKETESNFSLKLSLDGENIQTFDFNKNTILSLFEKFLPISSLKPNELQTILFEKENRNDLSNTFYYDLGLKYYLPAEQIPPRDEGITIERNLYTLTDKFEENPVIEAKVGEVLRGKITILTGKPRHMFAIEDFIPAGFELVNFNLSTEDSTLLNNQENNNFGSEVKPTSIAIIPENTGLFNFLLHPLRSIALVTGYTEGYDDYNFRSVFKNELYPDFKELRDDRLFIFKQELPAGNYTYEYFIRATTPGTFRHLPAVASELYFPENFGRTRGSLFQVKQIDK